MLHLEKVDALSLPIRDDFGNRRRLVLGQSKAIRAVTLG